MEKSMKDMWKKIIDSRDVIGYERESNELKTRIEARLNKDDSWAIFLTYFDGKGVSYTEEYNCTTQKDALDLITTLKNKRVKSKKELQQLKQSSNSSEKKLKIEVKREFRDYNVEKWIFSIEDGIFNNTVYIREADFIDVDIIINIKYKSYEDKIINYLIKNLGLEDYGAVIRENLFYYNENKRRLDNNSNVDVFINAIDFEFGNQEDEE